MTKVYAVLTTVGRAVFKVARLDGAEVSVALNRPGQLEGEPVAGPDFSNETVKRFDGPLDVEGTNYSNRTDLADDGEALLFALADLLGYDLTKQQK